MQTLQKKHLTVCPKAKTDKQQVLLNCRLQQNESADVYL